MMANAVAPVGADPIAGEDDPVVATVIITRVPVTLRANPTRVLIRSFMRADHLPPFASPNWSSAQRIANRILDLGEFDLEFEWKRVSNGLYGRYRDVETALTRLRRPPARRPGQ